MKREFFLVGETELNVYFGIKLEKTFKEIDNPHPLSVTRTLLEYFRNNGNLGIYHSLS